MSILFAQPTQLYLEISPEIQQKSWEDNQFYSHPSDNWRAYLNQICLYTFKSYLKEEYDFKVDILSPKQLASIWAVTNGSVINVGDKRIILIPSEAIDDDELRIPQEWVDIPSWIGDYYVAVQVNLDEDYLRIWGYATHQQIKNEADYDSTDKSYSLQGENLTDDISILWLTQELCPQESTQAEVSPLEIISEQHAENLLERLGNPEVIFPRLSIPFSLWASLLENNNWHQKLSNLRQGKQASKIKINLSRWFDNLFENTWQSPESFNFAFIPSRKISSSSPEVKRVKLLTIDPVSEDKFVLLFLNITRENDGRIAISTQLFPYQKNSYLPPNIKLSLLSEDDQIWKTIQARTHDNSILIPSFKCSSGFVFKIKVELNGCSHIESFEV